MNNKLLNIVYYLFCLTICGIFIFHVLNLSLGTTVYRVTKNYKSYPELFNVFAQGWAFFSIDPTDDKILVYRVSETGKMKELRLHNSQFKFAYGLKKENRIIYHVTFQLITHIPDTFYFDISDIDNLSDKYYFHEEQKKKCYKVQKSALMSKLDEGTYLIIKYKVMPWMWYSKYDKSIKIPGKGLYIIVE